MEGNFPSWAEGTDDLSPTPTPVGFPPTIGRPDLGAGEDREV